MDPRGLLIAVLAVVTAALAVGLIVMVAILLARRSREAELIARLRSETDSNLRALRSELTETTQQSMRSMGMMISENMGSRQDAINASLRDMTDRQERRFTSFATENEQKLENMRNTIETRLASIQEDNNKRLDEMRVIVDEKLQSTLDERMTKSFGLVNERLEQVYKGLGEMHSLAAGVGDLSKVLSNVKTRGILGEVQLGAIIEDIMSPEQYVKNVVTVSDSRNPVEYAIKLPAEDGAPVLLPIDSKFPMEPYVALMDAYESGDPDSVRAAQGVLRARIKAFAKDIRLKYVAPPETTEFALMFLPTEGLYAEAVKLGMVEALQREFRVNVAGPSTMAALLNSLQMGFRSVAIQRRSGEVWKVLGAVKTEFARFEDVLKKTQDKLNRANDDLTALISTRTRKIQLSLRNVSSLPSEDVARYLGEADPLEGEPDASLVDDAYRTDDE